MKKEQRKETDRPKSSRVHRMLSVIGVLLCVVLIPILAINCILIIRSLTNKGQVPTVGGVAPMVVLTDSMYPTIQSGDLIIVHTKDASQIEEGDVIAFFDPASSNSAVVTHRVSQITGEGESLAFRTKGDANSAEDSESVPAANLVGVYTGTRFGGVGNFVLFLSSTTGLIVFVFVPLAILILYDVIRRKLYDKALLKELDELKARQIQE